MNFLTISAYIFIQCKAERTKRMYALCPPHFEKIGNQCYFISQNKANWLDAHFECKDRNSKLAEPVKEDDRILRKYLQHRDATKMEKWIGGIYNWEQHSWHWGYNGAAMSYQSFSQMMPG